MTNPISMSDKQTFTLLRDRIDQLRMRPAGFIKLEDYNIMPPYRKKKGPYTELIKLKKWVLSELKLVPLELIELEKMGAVLLELIELKK